MCASGSVAPQSVIEKVSGFGGVKTRVVKELLSVPKVDRISEIMLSNANEEGEVRDKKRVKRKRATDGVHRNDAVKRK